MLLVAPLVVFALHAPAAPAAPVDTDAASARVAEALADADQIVRVHEAPGAVVFDLDRAGELFQLSVSLDDDGRVVASAIDWVGPTGDTTGIDTTAFATMPAIEQIDVDAARRIVVRGDGRAITLALVARS
ncbi:MAG: hypothetical protein F9K40_23370 [Kofleriaceae bacterium]|nr:MAG: hypothetical protein F9K40_23370 [Kofleriaceae bacterium]MBZ0232657.1 hypothetical protein [Kofleriaceae bacterium]